MSNSEPEQTPHKPLPDALKPRPEWPMWPFALAIVLFIAVYTYINLEYRKEEKPFEPHQAMIDRKNEIVSKNMYDWYTLVASPAPGQDPIEPAASIATQSVDADLQVVLPAQLTYYIASRPVLLPEFTKIEAPDSYVQGQPLRIRLHLPETLGNDERFRLLSFYKEGELYLLATLYVKELADLPAGLLQGELKPFAFDIPTDPIEAALIQARFHVEQRVSSFAIARQEAPLP